MSATAKRFIFIALAAVAGQVLFRLLDNLSEDSAIGGLVNGEL